ncbi:hypothetical protein A7982_13669 [Minicystis rosea]|nr:hypothetical protein A7982_13669 [Minicystis rosea]
MTLTHGDGFANEGSHIKVRYALTRGPEADAVADETMTIFSHASDDVVRAAAEDESEGLQHVVSWMLSATALGDQAGHAWLTGLIEKRLAHENSAVRWAAVRATSWLEWPDFRATRSDAAALAEAYALRDQGQL